MTASIHKTDQPSFWVSLRDVNGELPRGGGYVRTLYAREPDFTEKIIYITSVEDITTEFVKKHGLEDYEIIEFTMTGAIKAGSHNIGEPIVVFEFLI